MYLGAPRIFETVPGGKYLKYLQKFECIDSDVEKTKPRCVMVANLALISLPLEVMVDGRGNGRRGQRFIPTLSFLVNQIFVYLSCQNSLIVEYKYVVNYLTNLQM